MILKQLTINSLRSIHQASVGFDPHYSYIVGDNGAGKTSLLEAIYLLCSGHSFKTREISPLVEHDQEQFILYGRAEDTTLSMSKSLNETTIIKINGQPCSSTSQLAYLMPCQVYYQDIFQIIDAGPSVRRAMIDWGMFHVKHDYLVLWKQYKHLLKQRNSLLKQHPNPSDLKPWNEQLATVGEQISIMRENYIEALKVIYGQVLTALTDVCISLNYYKGWDKKNTGVSLLQAILTNQEKDIARGFTSVGIHQADIMMESQDLQAKKILSRGQQKMALISLKLSQSQMLQQHCIHLMDDVFAELDKNHQKNLADYMAESEHQFFITLLTHDSDKLAQFPQGEKIQLPLGAG